MPKNKNVLMNIHGVDFQIDDKSYKHFKSLPKIQQEAIKQTMILGFLKDRYHSLFCSSFTNFFTRSFGTT